MSKRPRGREPRIALVGRPNVGKSTLFNRLLGRREAIVHDRPGVTRDRIERRCRLGARRVLLVDTGGLVPADADELVGEVSRQALGAVAEADVVVLVVDGRAGITPLDEVVVETLHGSGATAVVAVNKVDAPGLETLALDAWGLGMGEPVPVSAEHGTGVEVLVERIESLLPPIDADAAADGDTAADVETDTLNVALVGRPNVGKSSLVNRLAGATRVTVSSVPGTTRDAIDVVLTREGQRIRLVDTAGLRKRSKVAAHDESIGILFTRRRLDRAHVAILVIDAAAGLTSQDVGIAGEIVRGGRPFLIAANKWDIVENREAAQRDLRDEVKRRLAFAPWAPLLTVSAASGQRVFRMLDEARRVGRAAQKRVQTAQLNRFLARTVGELLAAGGSAPKTLYATQTGSLPPRFLVFCGGTALPDDAFRRFLERRLREEFDLGPTPVVVSFRRSPRRD